MRMSRTMLSSVNDAAQTVARASSSDHLADVGRAAEKTLSPKRYKKYAPPVACAVAAAAVAVALFSSRAPLAAAAAAATAPYASDPTRPHSFMVSPGGCRLRDLPHRGPDGAARRGPPRKKKRGGAGRGLAGDRGPPEQRHLFTEGARAQGRLPRPRAALHGRHPGPHADLRRLRLRDPRRRGEGRRGAT